MGRSDKRLIRGGYPSKAVGHRCAASVGCRMRVIGHRGPENLRIEYPDRRRHAANAIGRNRLVAPDAWIAVVGHPVRRPAMRAGIAAGISAHADLRIPVVVAEQVLGFAVAGQGVQAELDVEVLRAGLRDLGVDRAEADRAVDRRQSVGGGRVGHRRVLAFDDVRDELVEDLVALPVLDAVDDRGIVGIVVDRRAGEGHVIAHVRLEAQIGGALARHRAARPGADHELAVVVDAGRVVGVLAGVGVVGLHVFGVDHHEDVDLLGRGFELQLRHENAPCQGLAIVGKAASCAAG